MQNFPDHFHLEKIRDALWQNREYGKASVMIGAGFSLNAVPRSISMASFPTWTQLAERMVDAFHPSASSDPAERERILQQARSTSGSLRLAEEYEAAFGRDSLEALILREIPDTAYEPSELHDLLLRLPWADVLTTNYDTLLERAAERGIDRRYDIVRTSADIPNCSKPRIVKLHGSFPSTRPFIVTEEDFRSYPRRFAPFVNLAQQAAMETVLCLMGFSGDDPNFLYWTGWVRDHLGKAAPQIYLCGLLNMNTARRNLLHDRNVVPIDLSPLFPEDKWLDNRERHRQALTWLLENLEIGQPPLRIFWPSVVNTAIATATHRRPPLIKTSHVSTLREELQPETKVPLEERLRKTTNIWRHNRLLYPGWLIIPSSNRNILWDRTRYWISEVGERKFVDLPIDLRFSFLFELVWRLDRCLMPLFAQMLVPLSAVLEEINPFPGSLGLPSKPIEPSTTNRKLGGLYWSDIRSMWSDLAFARFRTAREDNDVANYNLWLGRLTVVETELPQSHSRRRYEQILFALGRGDHRAALRELHNWNEPDQDPYWSIRRAGLFAELGHLDDALRLADEGLREIRRRIQPAVIDIPTLSREGWALLMVRNLRQAEEFLTRRFDGGPEFRGRWEQLSRHKCDPNPDWDQIDDQLEPIPAPKPRMEETLDVQGFFHRRFNSASSGENVLPAYAAIRMVEDSGLPTQCGNVTISRNVLLKAAKWLSPVSFETAAAGFIRTGEADGIRSHFSLARLGSLSDTAVNDLITLAEQLLAPQADENIAATAMPTKVALNLLTALVERMSEPQLESELDRYIALYADKRVTSQPQERDFSEYARTLLKRTGENGLERQALAILCLPIPGVDSFSVIPELWHEPITSIGFPIPKSSRAKQPEAWRKAVDWLIGVAKMPDSHARSRAVWRLHRLHRDGLLSNDETARFGKAVWAQVDEKTKLPRNSGLYNFALLSLPCRKSARVPKERFKAHYLATEVNTLYTYTKEEDGKTRRSFALGGKRGEHLDEIVNATSDVTRKKLPSREERIDWTAGEAKTILALIRKWWDEEGRKFTLEGMPDDDPYFRQALEEQLTSSMEVIGKVVLPRLARRDKVIHEIRKMLEEIHSSGVRVHSALPLFVGMFSDMSEQIASSILQGLASSDRTDVVSSMQAVHVWITQHEERAVGSAPIELLHAIGHIVAARREPSVRLGLWHSAAIVSDHPRATDETFVKLLLVGLQFLLKETQYSQRAAFERVHYVDDQKVGLRHESGKLAIALSKLGRKESIIADWMDAVRNDPLVYVRRALQDSE